MAFVADFNEEDLRKALEAAGGAPAVDSGPGEAPAPAAPSAGPAVPSPGAAPAGGSGAGTGFVNLSRYFDANTGGADRAAQGILDPLGEKIDEAIDIADSAKAPPPDVPLGSTGKDPTKPTPEYEAGDYVTDVRNEHRRPIAIKSTEDRIDLRKDQANQTVKDMLSDPNKIAEGLMNDKTFMPSQFDSYLAGASLPDAFQKFKDYWSDINTKLPPDANAPKPAPGSSPAVTPPPGSTPPAPSPDGSDAADVLYPDKRKNKDRGSWEP